MSSKKRVGVLTGGGDSSAINAFLRFLYLHVNKDGGELVGILRGWHGIAEGRFEEITAGHVDRVSLQPGTILGTSRTNIVKEGLLDTAVHNIEKMGLTHLVVAGGDDTLGVAGHLADMLDIPIIGVPQTIDNDIPGTDLTLGFMTAVQRGVEALHGAIPSNRAHGNPMLVEVMGRQAGWLSLFIAFGTEADFLAVPEEPWSIDELARLYKDKGPAITAIISEGVEHELLPVEHTRVDAFGNPALEGVVHRVADLFAQRTGKMPRVQVLGYLLRGGVPAPKDIHLALEFAAASVEAFDAGLTGQMVSWNDGEAGYRPLAEIVGRRRVLPPEALARWHRLMGNIR